MAYGDQPPLSATMQLCISHRTFSTIQSNAENRFLVFTRGRPECQESCATQLISAYLRYGAFSVTINSLWTGCPICVWLFKNSYTPDNRSSGQLFSEDISWTCAFRWDSNDAGTGTLRSILHEAAKTLLVHLGSIIGILPQSHPNRR